MDLLHQERKLKFIQYLSIAFLSWIKSMVSWIYLDLVHWTGNLFYDSIRFWMKKVMPDFPFYFSLPRLVSNPLGNLMNWNTEQFTQINSVNCIIILNTAPSLLQSRFFDKGNKYDFFFNILS